MTTGCIPSDFDIRDYKIKAGATASRLPTVFSLPRPKRIKNQGAVGSCVAHAISSILEYHENWQYVLSTNFIYGFNESFTPGMKVSEGCKIAHQYGDMLECDCPGNYEVPLAHAKCEAAKSKESEFVSAKYFRIESYFNCETNDDIKFAIMNYGPVLGVTKWYNNSRSNPITHEVVMDTTQPFTYHAFVIFGWNEKGFLCQNSWGAIYGDRGCFVLPYSLPVTEAKAFVDHVPSAGEHIVIPKNNTTLNKVYKTINYVVNAIKKKEN